MPAHFFSNERNPSMITATEILNAIATRAIVPELRLIKKEVAAPSLTRMTRTTPTPCC
jgi:hypothetical protein